MSLITSDEDEDNWSPDVRDELIRARDTVSVDFVTKMKTQRKDAALQRIKAEKEASHFLLIKINSFSCRS